MKKSRDVRRRAKALIALGGTGLPRCALTFCTVKEFDNLSIIARRFAFGSWRELYDLPENADFRAMRPNPNSIFVGDRVFIPSKHMAAGRLRDPS